MKVIFKNSSICFQKLAVTDITELVSFTTGYAYITGTSYGSKAGELGESGIFKASQKVDITGYSNISFTLPVKERSTGGLLGYGVVFFGNNDTVIEVVDIPIGEPNSTVINMNIPSGATTVGFTWWQVTDYGDFYAKVW